MPGAAVWSIEAVIDVLIDFLACDQVLLLYTTYG